MLGISRLRGVRDVSKEHRERGDSKSPHILKPLEPTICMLVTLKTSRIQGNSSWSEELEGP